MFQGSSSRDIVIKYNISSEQGMLRRVYDESILKTIRYPLPGLTSFKCHRYHSSAVHIKAITITDHHFIHADPSRFFRCWLLICKPDLLCFRPDLNFEVTFRVFAISFNGPSRKNAAYARSPAAPAPVPSPADWFPQCSRYSDRY